MPARFHDRREAGRFLGELLAAHAGAPGLIVMALPPGGVPVAAEVAHRLGASLDLLVVRELGLPCRQDLALGAIAPAGVCVLDDAVIERLDIESDAIGAVRRHEEGERARREERYRGRRPPPELRRRPVIVVDDGSGSGSALLAAVKYLQHQDAGRVIVAAAVLAPGTLQSLQAAGVEVIAGMVSAGPAGPAREIADCSPVADAEVRRLLEAEAVV